MKNRKNIFYVGCTVLLFIFIYFKFSENRLIKQGILLAAHTTEWAGSAKMGMNLKYEFFYNGNKILGDNSFENIRGLSDFENKYFPVIYDTVLGTSRLLIEPSDFKRFNMPYPDSLTWVLKYLK
jgi:hypothetical protein